MMRLLLCLLLCLLITSCRNGKRDVDEAASAFAPMEKRAVSLRESRFELANEIRNTEDTLLHRKDADVARLQLRLSMLGDRKKVLLSQSLALADTIKGKLDSVLKTFKDPAEKQQFLQKLNSKLASIK